jgi:hypothetical protein
MVRPSAFGGVRYDGYQYGACGFGARKIIL